MRYEVGPQLPRPEHMDTQTITAVGNTVDQIFDGIRPPEGFLNQPFRTQSTEVCHDREVSIDCSYIYYTEENCATIVRTPFDTVTVYWAGNHLLEDPDNPSQPLWHYRYVAARYVDQHNRAFRYRLTQNQPGVEWQLIQAREELPGHGTTNAQPTAEIIALIEQGFLRLKEMVSVALNTKPDDITLMTGRGAGQDLQG